jgi:hypothetical protein
MGNDVKRTEETAEDKAVRERREFLKTAGRFGITAPMAALLLSVKSKRASAGEVYNNNHVYD